MKTKTGMVLLLLAACGTAAAADVAAGRAKAKACFTCHGEGGAGNASSTSIPKLAGQLTPYLTQQIKAFRNGQRTDRAMNSISLVLLKTGQDVDNVTAYFASLPRPAGTRADPKKLAVGEAIYTEKCSTCHGKAGEGNPGSRPAVPTVGGQYKDYLVKSMQDYQNGARGGKTGNVMQTITKPLSIVELFALAEYMNSL